MCLLTIFPLFRCLSIFCRLLTASSTFFLLFKTLAHFLAHLSAFFVHKPILLCFHYTHQTFLYYLILLFHFLFYPSHSFPHLSHHRFNTFFTRFCPFVNPSQRLDVVFQVHFFVRMLYRIRKLFLVRVVVFNVTSTITAGPPDRCGIAI